MKRIVAVYLALSLFFSVLCAYTCVLADSENLASYREKAERLHASMMQNNLEKELGQNPAGKAGWVVFLSVCDGTSRAMVFSGSGASLEEAFAKADENTYAYVSESGVYPRWLKADAVSSIREISMSALKREVLKARHEFYRYGIAFDDGFELALLEAELNGAKIYEYENGGIDEKYLNNYLKKSGREPISALPDQMTLFQCRGWFCDEDNTVYSLYEDGLETGRREVLPLDAAYAFSLIDHASAFLIDQIKDDGSFVYGIYPRFDNDINNYNIVRHASTLWSLLCRYRMMPSEELEQTIRKATAYMLTQIIEDDNGAKYLYEAKNDEIKLGGSALAVISLTEFMETFQDVEYVDVCEALGQGILNMFEGETGEYWHVLNGDFSRKEKERTVYYDGEATFALIKLYGLTRNERWLDTASRAVDHFIAAEYEQYKDHWVAYSLNEITKYITDRQDYYDFALRNAKVNLQNIAERDTTYHTYLELLMATFEVYDRMVSNQIPVVDFEIQDLLDTIGIRAQRQLNGFFFPEYAMYMKNPQRILNTFMVRHDGYRIRIDDVQHNIGGYYLYYNNYEKMLSYGFRNDMY